MPNEQIGVRHRGAGGCTGNPYLIDELPLYSGDPVAAASVVLPCMLRLDRWPLSSLHTRVVMIIKW